MKARGIGFFDRLGRPIDLRARVALALLVIPLLLAFSQPLWRISMVAPQYPDGLSMDIYPHTVIGGHDNKDIREINILNHYIGMLPIDRTHLTDLDWMPFALGGLALFTLRVAAIGNVRSLVDLFVLTTYVCSFAFVRFAYKLYTYGHDLNPDAPVKVPGFMPALFGTKQIANFTTSSFPQLGTLFIMVFVTGVAVVTVLHLIGPRRAGAQSAPPIEIGRRGEPAPA